MTGIRRIFGKTEVASRVSPVRGGNPSFRVKIDWAPHLNKRGELVPQRHGLPLLFLPEFADSLVEALGWHRAALEQRHEPVAVASNRLKIIGYDREHEIVELETDGSLFFDTLASLLDVIDQKLPLDQRVAYALAGVLKAPRVEIWLSWRRRDRFVLFDENLIRRLMPLIAKEEEQRAHVDVEQSRYWRASLFVKVAHESAFAELSRELDARGLVCYVLEGARISDFSSFEEEGFRAGIFNRDDWAEQRPLAVIVPHKSAIIWRNANRLLEADPVALIEAIHSILPDRGRPSSRQLEVFLLGDGPLLTGRFLSIPR